MNKPGINRLSKAQRGFTMVEVLVSIVVFSVGLLGIAKLQMVSKTSNYDAVQRVTATNIAEDVVQRMRSNSAALSSYVSGSGSTTLGGGTIDSEPGKLCNSSNSPCNTAEMVTADLWAFEQQVDAATGLVSPTLCILGPAAGGSDVYTVAIAWRGKVGLSNPTRHACGSTSGKYGDSNEYRRVIVIETFIDSIV